MNLTEFLEKLSKTRNGWSVDEDAAIRKPARMGEHCPITAVCVRVKKVRFSTGDYPAAAARLGLSSELSQRIASAADGEKGCLHSRLLEAVGLK